MSTVDEAVAAIQAGKPVVLPTDTVYGLCTSPHSERYVTAMHRLKGRDETKPTALAAADLDSLFECVPELRGRSGVIAGVLLPGPYTLILPNPGHRFRWLTGTNPDAIGVRIPELDGPGADVLRRVGAVAATSANLAGGPEPRTVDEVPQELKDGVAAVVDGGELPGVPSTVIDFTGPEPVVLREGAGPAAEAIERVNAVLR